MAIPPIHGVDRYLCGVGQYLHGVEGTSVRIFVCLKKQEKKFKGWYNPTPSSMLVTPYWYRGRGLAILGVHLF